MFSTIARTSTVLMSWMLCMPSWAQLQVTSNVPSTQVVQNVLLGNGITASNITYAGNPAQLGTFNCLGCNVGLASGMLMSSGGVIGAAGPNDDASVTIPAGGFNGAGDNDLFMAAGSDLASHDAAVLQFDFVPTGDSLSFKFVFASDEYLVYVGSINDVFGFFLSGPGITGPYSNNAENIALVPGTASPVSINNVNDVTNSAYYINNGTGFNAPFSTDNHYIQYNGLTTVLTANAHVSCGSTYHIKLAISDISDGILDSGVFLEAGSFQSSAVVLGAEINSGGVDSTLYEGCGDVTLFFSREGNLGGTDTITVSVAGTATEGSDYTTIPDQLIFQPGVDTLYLGLHALLDAIPEPPELLELMAIWTGPCGSDTTFFHTYITDAVPLSVVLSNDTTLTCSDSTWVQADVIGGFGAVTLDWSSGIPDGSPSGWILPAQTTTYTLSLSDECGVYNPTADVTLTVFVPDPFVVTAHPDTLVHCPETNVLLTASVIGGTPGYTLQWSDALGAAVQEMVSPPVTHTYSVEATDRCGNMVADAVTVTVDYDSVRVTVTPDTLMCAGDTITLRALAQAGYNGYGYVWFLGSTGDSLVIHPTHTASYSVVVTDGCGIEAYDIAGVSVNRPIADFTTDAPVLENNFPITFLDQSVLAVQWSWDFGSQNLSSSLQFPIITYPETGVYDVRLAITDTLGCVDTLVKRIIVNAEFELYMPSAFTPDGDGLNDVFLPRGTGVMSFRMTIFDRWGREVFSSEDMDHGWDGTVSGKPAMPGIYVYNYRYLGDAGRTADRFGQVMLVR